MFAISGEKLTMRLRQMAFKALLRQVLHFYCLTVVSHYLCFKICCYYYKVRFFVSASLFCYRMGWIPRKQPLWIMKERRMPFLSPS